MSWDQGVQAFAAIAFVWIWRQLHGEVKALRDWRHIQEAKLPALETRVLELENWRVRVQNNLPKGPGRVF